MPTNLTTPIGKNIITDMTLDGFRYVVSRNGDMTVNVPSSKAFLTVGLRDEDGSLIESRNFESQIATMPVAVRAAIKAVHEAIIDWAKISGKIPPGVDTPDF